MGWTWYRASHYDNRGRIDKKAECDAYFNEGYNRGYYIINKSTMVGNAYYAAVTPIKRYADNRSENDERTVCDIPINERETFAVIMLTSVDNSSYYNFGYKYMDESYGPVAADCPTSILDLLSPIENEHANLWRQRCKENSENKRLERIKNKRLNAIPIGTCIKFKDTLGRECKAVKMSPNSQFKTCWWYVPEHNCYVMKSRIPYDFEVQDSMSNMNRKECG